MLSVLLDQVLLLSGVFNELYSVVSAVVSDPGIVLGAAVDPAAVGAASSVVADLSFTNGSSIGGDLLNIGLAGLTTLELLFNLLNSLNVPTQGVLSGDAPSEGVDSAGSEWADTVVGTASSEFLFGGGGFDLIVSGGGNDLIWGDGSNFAGDADGGLTKSQLLFALGAAPGTAQDGDLHRGRPDVIRIDNNPGSETTIIFEQGVDRINLAGFSGVDFAYIQAHTTTVVSGNLVGHRIDLGNGQILGIVEKFDSATESAPQLQASDFIAYSTLEELLDTLNVPSAGANGSFTLSPAGGAGDDTIVGTGADEFLMAGAGADHYITGGGNDLVAGDMLWVGNLGGLLATPKATLFTVLIENGGASGIQPSIFFNQETQDITTVTASPGSQTTVIFEQGFDKIDLGEFGVTFAYIQAHTTTVVEGNLVGHRVDLGNGQILGMVERFDSATESAPALQASDFLGLATNTAPDAMDDMASISEDAGATMINVLANDSDPDAGDILSVTAVNTAGTLGEVLLSGGVVTYNPNGQFESLAVDETATDTFTYTINDGHPGGDSTATVTVTITGENDAPMAVGSLHNVVVDENTTNNIAFTAAELAAAFHDVDASDILSYMSNFTPPGGLFHMDVNGNLLFDAPDVADFTGYGLLLNANDGHGGTASSPFTLLINNVNQAPVAADDAASISEDAGATMINVLANDSDPDAGDILSVTAVNTAGTLGEVLLSGGVVTYNPNGQFESLAVGEMATDTFTYTINDGHPGGDSTATVTVTITGENDAPVAVGSLHNVVVNENTTNNIAFTAAELAAAFHDVDASDILSYMSNFTPPGGLFHMDVNGNLLFDAPDVADFTGYGLLLNANDGHGGTASSPFTLLINNVNQAPVAVDDTAATLRGVPVVIDVLANDTDPDASDTHTVAIATGLISESVDIDPSEIGSLVVNPDGTITYNAGANFLGEATFEYSITDNHGASDIGMVTVTVDALGGEIIGTAGDDIIITRGNVDDFVVGGGGNDTMQGKAGNDTLIGGTGNDTISGGAGADHIEGNEGNDVLKGDAANDVIYGGKGDDLINGGGGFDTLYGNLGNDTVIGGSSADTILGGEGADVLTGNAGADVFVMNNNDFLANILDRITDFNSGTDHIDLTALGVTALSLAASYNAGTNITTISSSGNGVLEIAGNYTLNTGDFLL